MTHRIVHPLLVAAAFLASAAAWARLPASIAVHWNLAGEVDRYGSRFEGALLLPAMMLFIWGVMRVLPAIDPRRANYPKMAGTYDFVITLTLVAMLGIHGAVLGTALGYPVPIGTVIPLVVGVMLMALGNVLPRARPNWWFGIRTPWTLSSDRVWTRTHRVAGYSMMASGLAVVLIAFLHTHWLRVALIGAVALGALFPAVYSYVAWRQEEASR